MATRSLISLYALLATSAVITQSAEARFRVNQILLTQLKRASKTFATVVGAYFSGLIMQYLAKLIRHAHGKMVVGVS